MSALKPVRGTHDLLPDEKRRHGFVAARARAVASLYGYEEISTPIFESTDVFSRTLGDTSDIVTKEMYTFEDRGGDLLTLRPEGTAGIARAYISGGWQQISPLKVFYQGPMFRYERPQKGRLRQFHQVGVELLGIAQPQGDVEAIAMGAHVLEALGVKDKVTLELNSLGDEKSRRDYRTRLVAFLNDHRDALSEDSKARLERNPLRILDSKDAGDRAIIADAPLMRDSFTDEAKIFFDTVMGGLDALEIAYRVNQRLVRGLDYYCHTAFEFMTTALGAQGTVLAGGRYDGLIRQMGGPVTPGIGWAAGVERLAMLIDEPPAPQPMIALVPTGEDMQNSALVLADRLRKGGVRVDLGYAGNVGKRMKRANKIGAAAAIVMGADEYAREAVTVRDMRSGEQNEVAICALAEHLARFS
ncbi:histidine--tRNA ligase [Varunaivibrio sulfuroxidans]|uniref:Histidine--tRNA ligase n=1 Tax=Varunaivibrio sulfuroxidans TaxID=1773489 RepID=A0A4R3JJN6_9PROT|nr:histidine--tRNA ligase [Varunaivibrio sulfuroxidans]TCS65100.1 histidyl-tRNA synthetase [Varunaivibrio sulfuroxidans]WES29613.1 histidine--tRNA ligase [Varunaivibrio sulfuroxidans]